MAITSAMVLFAVIWFATLFLVLPIRLKTQAETGDVVPGTPRSAPENPQIKRRALIVTAITIPVWIAVVAIILSGVIPLDSFEMFKTIHAVPIAGGTNG